MMCVEIAGRTTKLGRKRNLFKQTLLLSDPLDKDAYLFSQAGR